MKPEVRAINSLLDSLNALAQGTGTEKDLSHAIDTRLSMLPHSTREALTGLAVEKLKTDPARMPLAIATFAGVLLQEYDGTPLTLTEWRELRDLISDCADELDMNNVTYAMSLIMDYGAL